MSERKLLGATLLHTRYGHWQHPQSGRFFIRPVRDNFFNYPGLIEELVAIRQRALNDEHTIHDQQRIQWLAQASFGALGIYQQGISIRAVSRAEIIEAIDDWFASQAHDLVTTFFAAAIMGD
ncbi:MAG: hypothetical protein V9G20_01475 [Candidatus Promineifilaceae bacterium]